MMAQFLLEHTPQDLEDKCLISVFMSGIVSILLGANKVSAQLISDS